MSEVNFVASGAVSLVLQHAFYGEKTKSISLVVKMGFLF